MCSSDAPLPANELAFTMSVRQLLVFLCGRVLTEGVELARVVAVERLLAVALLAELRDWVLLVADRWMEAGLVDLVVPMGPLLCLGGTPGDTNTDSSRESRTENLLLASTS